MIVYSKILSGNSDIFLIKLLRKNKWFWIDKFFFDHLSTRQTLILIKSLLIRSHKVVFVQFEGKHSWRYYRPESMADLIFGYKKIKKCIYWNVFFDEASKNIDFSPRYAKKSISNLIPEICFISSNIQKIADVKKKYSDLYKKIHIYGNFHHPIENDKNIELLSGKELDRSYNSLFTTSRYMASLCIENSLEEGYAQCSALWSLRALTPPILKTQPCRKNFIRSEFYIDFDEYIKMSKQQRLVAICNVQERLLSGESYLTNLTKDYLEFFRESFSGNNEPDIKKITLESQAFRTKFITI